MNYAAINDLVGSDWSYPDNDCWQVFRKAALNVFGIHVKQVEIPKAPSIKKNACLFLQYSQENQWQKIKTPLSGCAVLFRNARGLPTHIGIYIDGGNVLHCFGAIDKPGKTTVQNTSYLKLIYPNIEYYEYAPDND